MSDCQVLVVGAGPTGLVLAAELLVRGINTRIIDQGDGIVLQTRALGVHARTLEVLDSMGLADEFVARGHQVRQFRFYSDGKSLAALDMSLNDSRFPFMLDIPQHETEALLRERVRELGGVVEPNTQLTALHQDSNGVTATISNADGGSSVIRAEYVVGSDGAHSRVRHELGLSFEGHPYDEDWLLADVHMDWSWREDEVHALFRSRGAPMICFPMRDHVWRIVFPYTGDRGRRAPTLEEIQSLVDERAPVDIRVSQPSWLANFRCHRRSSHEYRRGRVMLAGDAVHVHSPAGGQGMNTGMMDAHNLGWKLALVASGRAPEALLDTYAEERGPVARQVLGLTHALVQIATVQEPIKRTLRNLGIPLASRMPVLQRRAVRRLSNVHVEYRGSSLTRGGGRRTWKGLRPGDRAPDVPVSVDGRTIRLHTSLRSTRHLLVLPPDLDVRQLEEVPEEVQLARGLDRTCAAYLVRPDGYLAAQGVADIQAYLGSVFTARQSAGDSSWAASASGTAISAPA